MRKFYSFVLMAAALLIGTNAWAETRTVASESQLISAWQNVENGDIIQLTNDVDITKTLWLGTKEMTDDAISITLDLNGHLLRGNVTAGNYPAGLRNMFVITHGALNVVSSIPNGRIYSASYCFNNPSGADKAVRQELFRLSGSDDANGVDAKTATPFTHLTIGEGVIVEADALNAIVVDAISTSFPNRQHTNNAVMAGANVDGYNAIELTTYADDATVTACPYAVSNRSNGVRVDISGSVKAKLYALKVNGNVKTPTNRSLAPYIYIHPTGDMYVPGDFKDDVTNPTSPKRSVAVYASGYGRFLIEGTCAGATGVYAKSGEITIEDATISSNCTEDYEAVKDKSAGVSGHGSAVVIHSNSSTPGNLDVTIGGDSKLSATNGYALEESVTTTQTKVDSIRINGGTFAGGQIGTDPQSGDPVEGTIVITQKTANSGTQTVEINGLSVTGTGTLVSENEDGVSIGGQTLAEYFASQGTETHVTAVPDGDGSYTYVISAGPAPEAPAGGNYVSTQADSASIKWTVNTVDAIQTGKHLILKELEINTNGLVQTLTIQNGATLEVGRVILGPDARIIVEAGGKFIVYGDQGIIAPSANNILLKTSETAQAMFFFNPAVSSNRHPNATVEMTSKGYKKANGQFVYQRFGVPSYDKDAVTRAAVVYDHTAAPTAIYKFDYENDIWTNMADADKFIPFRCYELTTTATTAGAVYAFQCPLVGNDNGELKLESKWNYYANSYTAPINIAQIVGDFQDNYGHISGTVYLYRASDNWWYEINNANIGEEGVPTEINPMQAFIFQRMNAGVNPQVNYKRQIWNPIMDPSANLAPARNRKMLNKAIIEITAANGTKDMVRLVEGEQFSAEFDNGYDAEKYMSNAPFSISADAENAQMAILATDNLEGTALSMTTKDETSFTMSFRNVNGLNYAVRDMLTGTVTEIVEGATYMFSVPANATVEGRFQIVEKANAPTAIDNIEETATIKGIYTITGQFVGNDYHSLPNGVYVVDGKKIVK